MPVRHDARREKGYDKYRLTVKKLLRSGITERKKVEAQKNVSTLNIRSIYRKSKVDAFAFLVSLAFSRYAPLYLSDTFYHILYIA